VSKRISLGFVVGVFGILGSTAVFAQDPCAGQKLSKKVDKPIGAAQKAFEAKNWDEVIAKAAEAEAMTEVTKIATGSMNSAAARCCRSRTTPKP
jgi:hypothetical protein